MVGESEVRLGEAEVSVAGRACWAKVRAEDPEDDARGEEYCLKGIRVRPRLSLRAKAGRIRIRTRQTDLSPVRVSVCNQPGYDETLYIPNCPPPE